MARARSGPPWIIVVLFVTLFFVAWWIEDCLIYYVDWSEISAVRLGVKVAHKLNAGGGLALIGNAFWLIGHAVGAAAASVSGHTAAAFDAIPPDLRATRTLRFVRWIGATLTATFGGDAALNLALGLEWAAGKLLRFIIAVNGACWLYNLGRRGAYYAALAIQMPIRFYSERETETGANAPAGAALNGDGAPANTRQRRREYVQFFGNHIERIGIILPGGGAKGAYQAGALKAIYEFLADYNSLHKVRMIAATSTGAWNAMFWLTGLMVSRDEQAVTLERWWKSISFAGLMDFPWLWLPFRGNSILRCAPWRESFAELFRKRCDSLFVDEPETHFYFGRSGVADGVTRYATNWRGIAARIDELGLDKADNYRGFEIIETGRDALKRMAAALFASIGMPPLFPYSRIGRDLFEDGGAADGIPFRLGAPIENCDLLFVLPLNRAPAGGPVNSTTRRLLRVMDQRQGAIEHAALKNADLINRMAERMERIGFGISALEPIAPAEGLAADAMAGLREEITEFDQEFKRLYIFTACPAGDLEIDTFGLWKRRRAADAFDLMYVQTRRELQQRFFEDIEPEDTHVVMIDGAVPPGDDLPKPTYRRPAHL
jgi:predicted acylesterase/phospholipase RssA